MPKVTTARQQTRQQNQESEAQRRDRETRAALAAWAEFEMGFRRSKKGNLWRHYQGLTLCVFSRSGEAGYRWSIASSDEGVRYSQEVYSSEGECLSALWSVVGEWAL